MNRKSNNSTIDWQELDRLVDGRLGEDEYRQLICQIDSNPNGWKQCALAFLEHQALEKELSAFASDPSCRMLPCMGSILAEKEMGLEDAIAAPSTLPSRNQANHWGSAVFGWVSMALCIVGGLAIGFTINSDLSERLSPGGIATGENNALVEKGTAPLQPQNAVQQGEIKKETNLVNIPGKCRPCPRTHFHTAMSRQERDAALLGRDGGN